MRSALVPILLADPLPWAQKAEYAWDFLRDRARFGGGYRGLLANTPGWTFTRASTGYYTTTGGVLVPFASGSLRTGDRGALIEGARTNLCLQSQTFDNASWTKGNGGVGVAPTVTANYAAAPDGTTTADRLQFSLGGGTATSDFSDVYQANATTGTLTFSVYLKSTDGSSSYAMQLKDANGSSISITVTGSWTRFEVSASSSGSRDYTIRLRGGQTPTHPNTADILAWGAQLEAASFPSSYIPTTTASATRAADSLSITGVTGLDYPLSLFAEFERAVNTATQENQLYVYNTDSNERALVHRSSGGGLSCLVTAGGVTQGSLSSATSPAVGVVARVAARIALNDVNVAGGGVLATADTSVTLPSSPTTIRFGSSDGGTFYSFGYLRRCALWTRALTDSELQSAST